MRKRKAFLGFAVMLALSMVGCGKKYNANEIQNDINKINNDSVSEDNKNTASDAQMDKSDIPDSIEYLVENDVVDASVTINAEVDSELYNKMGVYEIENAYITNDDFKKLAESLFDNGEYEVRKPFWMMSEAELDETKAWWESQYELNDTLDMFEYQMICVDSEEGSLEDFTADLQDGRLIYEMGDTGFEEGYVVGLVDDREWVLRCRNNPYMLEFKPLLSYPECSQYDSVDADFAENTIDYDRAEEMAIESLNKLGIDDMAVQVAKQRSFVDDGHISYDGYMFIFTKKVGDSGQTIAYFENNAYREDDVSGGSEQEYAVVEIDKNGCLCTDVYNRNNIIDSMSDDSSMLSFDRINEIMLDYYRDNLKEIYETYYTSISINKVLLAYVAVSYGDQRVLMPYWLYQSEDNNFVGFDDRGMLGVNAIDGQIITFGWDNRFYYANARKQFAVSTLTDSAND